MIQSPPPPSIHQAKRHREEGEEQSDNVVEDNAQPNHKPTLLETDDLPDLRHDKNPQVNLLKWFIGSNVQPN